MAKEKSTIAPICTRDIMPLMQGKEKDQLARKSMKIVDYMVVSEHRKLGSRFDKEDIRSFALEGLADAIERYDPARKVPFSVYAKRRIQGAIYDGVSEATWLPRRLFREIKFYRQSRDVLQSYCDVPPPEDKVDAVHQLADRLKELAAAYVTTYVSDVENERAIVEQDAEEELDRKRFSKQLRVAIDGLPSMQRKIVHDYYLKDVSLVKLAKTLDISKSWASKLLSAGLLALRSHFDDIGFSVDDL